MENGSRKNPFGVDLTCLHKFVCYQYNSKSRVQNWMKFGIWFEYDPRINLLVVAWIWLSFQFSLRHRTGWRDRAA